MHNYHHSVAEFLQPRFKGWVVERPPFLAVKNDRKGFRLPVNNYSSNALTVFGCF
jgi:hypothetical protein